MSWCTIPAMSDKAPKTDVITLSDVPPVSFITSGVKEIDELTGGYPKGRITQVYGLSAVGKTSLMLKCLAAISKDHKVLYIDVENALNVERAAELGADLLKIDYSNLSVLEDVAELVRNSITSYQMIVVDSIAMLTPRAEHQGETGEAHVGLKPRLIGQWLREMTEALNKSGCALILINQMRRSMEMYGDPYVLPGGMQLKFSSSLMLKLSTTKADQVVKDKAVIGHWVHVKVDKTKVSKPHLTSKFKLTY